ncbi:Lrp/AsnC family transcriptional regulator [Cryptosporangium aurantiacum]|uniref:Lrp/AsnC family transcriptional regulator n=1 Tax=Cryptosporangium aurantiacum TaxID=134849 RepID=UPI001C4A521A|nr:Lrp/AsnC family transcriptional regulator [Cryptosporangium aurantiacum]
MNSLRSEYALDDVDWRILTELQRDGRLSFNELGRRIHLSAPSVADRVRKLEQAGVITGYRAVVDPQRAGHGITAFVQLRCALGSCLLRTGRAADYPEVVEIHKLSGAHCTILKLRATTLAHLEGVIEQLGRHGEMHTHVVLSTQFDEPTVSRPGTVDRPVTPATGWTSPAD